MDFPGFNPELKLYRIIFFWIQPRIEIIMNNGLSWISPRIKIILYNIFLDSTQN